MDALSTCTVFKWNDFTSFQVPVRCGECTIPSDPCNSANTRMKGTVHVHVSIYLRISYMRSFFVAFLSFFLKHSRFSHFIRCGLIRQQQLAFLSINLSDILLFNNHSPSSAVHSLSAETERTNCSKKKRKRNEKEMQNVFLLPPLLPLLLCALHPSLQWDWDDHAVQENKHRRYMFIASWFDPERWACLYGLPTTAEARRFPVLRWNTIRACCFLFCFNITIGSRENSAAHKKMRRCRNVDGETHAWISCLCAFARKLYFAMLYRKGLASRPVTCIMSWACYYFWKLRATP